MFKFIVKKQKKNKSKYIVSTANMPEYCVLCGCETEYTRETPIEQRRCYVAAVGQLCGKCYLETIDVNEIIR